jgi:hypothetical protein
MTAGISFAKRLLESFCTGFAIAAGVHFVVFPVTCRAIVFKEFAGYLAALQGGLKAHQAYLHSLEDPKVFGKAVVTEIESKSGASPEAAGVRAAIGGLTALHGKLQGDLPFAKREIAIGKLGPDDINEMNKLVRGVMLPIVGLGAIMGIFDRLAASLGWTEERIKSGLDPAEQEMRNKVLVEWSGNMKALRDPFDTIVEVMDEGLEHVALQLQLKKAPKPEKTRTGTTSSTVEETEDVEARAESTKPGDKGFADYLDQKSKAFNAGKQQTLKDWCTRHGINLSEHFFEHPADAPYTESSEVKNEDYEMHQRNQRQLYMLLYVRIL